MKATSRYLLVAALVLFTIWLGYPFKSSRQIPPPAGNGNPGALSVSNSISPNPPGQIINTSAVVSRFSRGLSVNENIPPAHAAFSDWAEKFSARDASANPAQGEALAWKRREAMLELIEADPEKALALTVPYQWRHALPPSITRHFEQWVDGRGDFFVIVADRPGGGDTVLRQAVVGGKSYRVFVYGRRLFQKTQSGVPLHGIALGDKMALHADPIRVLESEEAGAIEQELGRVAITTCGVCGKPADSQKQAIIGEIGGETAWFCGPEHLRLVMERWMMASGGSGGIGVNFAPGGANLWTRGPKDVLYMRVNFPDDLTEPISETDAYDVMDGVNSFFVANSYDTTWLTTTVTPLVTLPQTKSYYTTAGPGALLADARAVARKAGFDTANYELDIVSHTVVPEFDWGGLGMLGGKGTWLQSYGAGVTAHELGHNYGVIHANLWDTTNTSVIGIGTNREYGNSFDTMGVAGAGNYHFNANFKNELGWLPNTVVHDITSNGVYRIYPFDAPERANGRFYGAKTRKDFSRDYWLEFRQTFAGDTSLQNGILLNWSPWDQSSGGTQLLDTTPGTPSSVYDSALLIGRTFSDMPAGVHITTLARGATGTDPWLDVRVNIGDFSGNQLPELKVEMDPPTNASPGQLIHFHATATDPDGDALAYSWFGTTWANDDAGSFSTNNLPWTFRSWGTPGERVIRCVVSDMKGGVASANVVVTVGTPTGNRISGAVLDEQGESIEGVRVDNATTNPATATAYTDSNGRYALVGLSGDFELSATKPGYTFTNATWQNPITVGPDFVNADFVAIPLTNVTITSTTNAISETNGSPQFITLTRTGNTSNSLDVAINLSGTANPGTDFILNPPLNFGSNTVTFPVDSNSIVFTFTANNDVNAEGNETMSLTLYDDPTGNYFIPRHGEAAITILDNDLPALPQVSVEALAGVITENGMDSAVLEFTRTGGTNSNLTVFYSVAGTATSGTDFPTPLGVLIIPAGSLTARVTFSPYDDKDVERDETIIVSLSPNATYTIGFSSDTITILDDDLLVVTISPTGDGLAEPSGSGWFTIKRDGDQTANLVVYYSASGTASSGVDYSSPSGAVTIPAGATSVDVFVSALNDPLIEGDESITLTLTQNPGYNIGTPGRATLFLRDDEKIPVNVYASDGGASEPGSDFGQFTISRGSVTSGDLTVTLAISGTAISGADYLPLENPVVIPDGLNAVMLDLIPFDDLHYEPTETVIVQIAASTNYNFDLSGSAVVDIEDNEDTNNLPAVGFSFLTSSTPESESPGISVSLSHTSAVPVEVKYRVIGGTASSNDYSLPQGVLTFAPGETVNDVPVFGDLTLPIPVPIINDTIVELNETIRVVLFDPTNATHDAYRVHTYTIIDDDISGVSIAATAGASEAGLVPGNFRITRTGATNSSLLVNLQITGTATAPGDYTTITNVVTVPAGATFVDLPVTPIPDGTIELDETVVVTLISAAGGKIVAPSAATATITDNPTNNLPVVTVASTNAPYAVEGGGSGAFVFTRSGSTTGALILYLTYGGTAGNGTDCSLLPATVTIPIGQTLFTLPVAAINDALIEGEETVIATLTQRDTYRISYPADATVTIQDNDQNIRLDASDFESAEPGTDLGGFTLTRFGTTNTSLQVFFTISGTASNGVDYTAITNSFVIPAGNLSATLPIQPLDDFLVEGHETVTLTLQANAAHTIISPSTGTVTILDDEPLISITATVSNVVEGSKQPGVFTLTRGGNPDYDFTARLSIGGTAAFGVDYLSFLTNVYFPCGVVSIDLLVFPTNEIVIEPDETVVASLVPNPAYTVLPPTNATITIIDAGANQTPLVTITSPTADTVFLLGTNVNMILEATVFDDSDTNTPVMLTWTNMTVETNFAFGDITLTNTTVSFTNDGIYVLRLTADDGLLNSYDEVTVVVDTLGRLSTNLLHWALNDGSGTNALDSSGNGRHGAASGTVSWTTNGAVGGALGLSGSNPSVRETNNTAFLNGLKQFSMALWLKPSVTNTDLGIFSAADSGTNATLAFYAKTLANCGNATNVIEAIVPSSRGSVRHISASNAKSNNWTHLALTWSNGLAPALFINGQMDQPLARMVGLRGFVTNCPKFILGQSPLYSANGWNGFFDDVRVFSRALHPAEVAALSATNYAPVVEVPTNTVVQILTPVQLPGTVTDDGRPMPPGTPSITWTQMSGPVVITITNPASLTNYVEFLTPGEYVFRLIADDTQVKIYGDSKVIVTEPTQVNVFATDGDAAELGPDTGEIMFLRVGDTNFDLTINIAISGIASNGADFPFIPLVDSVTLLAGAESVIFPVVPFLDHRTEGDETFTCTIISNIAYTIGSGQGTVTIHDSPYGMWNIAHFTLEELTDPTLSGEGVDFDHDSRVNFAEYAANQDPKGLETNTPLATTIELDPGDGLNHITLTYQRRLEPRDVSYEAVVSTDLLTWNSSTNHIVELSATDDGNGLTETVKARLVAPWPNGTNQFITVRVWLRATGP